MTDEDIEWLSNHLASLQAFVDGLKKALPASGKATGVSTLAAARKGRIQSVIEKRKKVMFKQPKPER